MKRLLQLPLLTFVCSLLFAAPAFARSGPQSSTPPELGMPDGFEKMQSTTGYSFQIYDCPEDGAWEFRNPSAALFDNNTGELSAIHFGGPTWQSLRDGSSVVGKVQAEVPASDPERNIPWLLPGSAGNTGGPGSIFGETEFIRRLDTKGGVEPSGSCTPGKVAYIPYKATYNSWSPTSSSY